MSDDTLDIDELDDIEDGTELDELDEDDEATPEPEAPEEDQGPGLLSKVGSKVAAPFARIDWGGFLTLKAGIVAVVVFLLVWLILVNLPPVRVVLWLWPVDIPKALAFAVLVAIGAGLVALLLWRKGKGAAEEAESK